MVIALFAPAMALAGTGSISGTMTHGGVEAGAPVVEGMVCVLKSENEALVENQNCREDTLPDGHYIIPNLPSGDYKIRFWPSWGGVNWVWEYYGETRSWSKSPWLEITDEDITGINAELPESGYIAGTVTTSSGRELRNSVRICAEEPLTEFIECMIPGLYSGEYSLFGLIEGSYRVHFIPEEGLGVRPVFNGGALEPSEAKLVHVTTGVQTDSIDVQLPAEATITGRVSDVSTHTGLEGIEVCAFELTGREITECESTGSSGSYSITDLPTGTYKVGFFAESEEEEELKSEISPYPVQYWKDRSSWQTADILNLGLGVTSGIDAELGIPPASPSLPASSNNGAPVTPFVSTPTPRRRCPSGTKGKRIHGKTRCAKVRHIHRRSRHNHRRPSSPAPR